MKSASSRMQEKAPRVVGRAAAEGEGDLTLEWWRRIHWAYYERELQGTGYVPRLDMPIVCESFECLYPPADQAETTIAITEETVP